MCCDAAVLIGAPLTHRPCIQAFALHAPSVPTPTDCCPVTGVLQDSPCAHKGRTHPAGVVGECLKEAGLSRVSSAFPRGAVLQSQYDVCYRGCYSRVPACTAAQLGLHVFARQTEQRLWRVQSRVGRFSSGHEQLQAQRSRSELQLSQQVLPSEEWGRVHVPLSWWLTLCMVACRFTTFSLMHRFIFFNAACLKYLPQGAHEYYSIAHVWLLLVAHAVNLTCMPSLGRTVVSGLDMNMCFVHTYSAWVCSDCSGVSVQVVGEWHVEKGLSQGFINVRAHCGRGCIQCLLSRVCCNSI